MIPPDSTANNDRDSVATSNSRGQQAAKKNSSIAHPGAQEGLRAVVSRPQNLRQPEVDDFYLGVGSLRGQKQVLGLEISVNDVQRVHVRQGGRHLKDQDIKRTAEHDGVDVAAKVRCPARVGTMEGGNRWVNR